MSTKTSNSQTSQFVVDINTGAVKLSVQDNNTTIIMSESKPYTGTTDATLAAGELVVVTQDGSGFSKFNGTDVSLLLGDSFGIVAVPTAAGLVNGTSYEVYNANSIIDGTALGLSLTASGVALAMGQEYFADLHLLKPSLAGLSSGESTAIVGKASQDDAQKFEVFSRSLFSA